LFLLQPGDRRRNGSGSQNHARVKQESPFCPNIAPTPDGQQVWFTVKDIGKTQIFEAKPPFKLLKTLETGPITNHVNFAKIPNGVFAYVTVGGNNEVKVFNGRLRAGCHNIRRQFAAWHLAVRRRHADVCRS
jgi:hypothetical protein